jgi:T4 bacteriophage base plate protein
MALPKISHPLFKIVIPSTNKTHTFRPFLVKEEKLLLTAQQSGELKELVLSLKQVINNCQQDDLDVDTLTLFDIEYLFLKLRAKSVNNVVDITITDKDDSTDYKISVDLEEVKIIHDPKHTNKVTLDNGMTLTLRYPNVDLLDKIQMMAYDVDQFFDVIKYCIESVEYQGTTTMIADCTSEEVDQFVQQLGVKDFNYITEFFDTMPKMKYVIKYTNAFNQEKEIVLQTLADFFILR